MDIATATAVAVALAGAGAVVEMLFLLIKLLLEKPLIVCVWPNVLTTLSYYHS